MKKRKKMFGIGTAVFIIIMMISSATAVPVVNEDAVETTQEQNPSTLIDKCWEYWNNPEFRAKLAEAKANVEIEINKLPEQDRELIREYLDLENTFSISGIAQRISTIGIFTYMEDTQNLLKVPDNYDEYNESRQEMLGKLLELFYNNDFEFDEMYYPLVNVICFLMRVISLIWTIPLTILFGVIIGLPMACLISMIFFSPITVPMSVYTGLTECWKNDPDFKDEILAIAVGFGLAGLIVFGTPLILGKLWKDGYYNLGWKYVMSKVLLISWEEIGGSIIPITGETEPWIYFLTSPSTAKVNKPVKFTATIIDVDKVFFDGDEGFRDYVHVGYDWNNDFIVDEWTNLEKEEYQGWSLTEIDTYHTFTSVGVYHVHVIARDHWGLRAGGWTSQKITIEEKKDINSFQIPMNQNNVNSVQIPQNIPN